MLTIQGAYDGKTFSALPSEPLPRVQREVLVAIVFLEEFSLRMTGDTKLKLRSGCVRPATPCHPWALDVKELIEAGREG